MRLRSKEEGEAKVDMVSAGCRRMYEGWFEKENALCRSIWMVGVNLIAAGLW